MTSAKTRRARQIFFACLRRDTPHERAEIIERECHGDDALQSAVINLLEAHEDNGDFLDVPFGNLLLNDAARNGAFGATPESPPDSEQPGSRIGPYKLLQQIGEGGFGVVYMAEQTRPVRRKVALKIIKPGMDTKEVIARFEAERQALALMDHPNIAKVLDAGTTSDVRDQESEISREDGRQASLTSDLRPLTSGAARPYFVMELVHGIPITEFCDENRLTTRERLELFVAVCRAVQHAHQKGIIHRDLKPSNVLITMNDDRPMPKVIDFGISKALSQQLTEKTLFTAYGQMVGTPLYMSPEQAQFTANDVDTRSDVYSLGVLLYELLTGHTPFDKDTLQKSGFDEMRRLIREVDPPRPSARVSTLQAAALSTVSGKRKADPRKLGQSLRGELDWIVMKALEKDRNRRYESASAFAADIERYLADEPVQACPPSLGYRLQKAVRRHRVALATVTLVAAAMLGGTVVATREAVRATAAEQQAGKRLVEANTARGEAEKQRERAAANYVRAREAVKQMLTRVADKKLVRIPQMKGIRRQLLQDAVAFYTELLKVDPRDPVAYYERARVYELLMQYDKVRSDYEKALDLDPENAERHRQFAWFLNSCPDVAYRDVRSSERHTRCAIRLEPGNSWDHVNLAGMYRFKLGKPKEAAKQYRLAAEFSRSPAERHWYLMDACLLQGDDDGALEQGRLAITYNPQQSEGWPHLRMAQIYHKRGQYEEAIAAASNAISVARKLRHESANAKSFYFFNQRARSYAALKKYREALADYDTAVAAGPFRSYTYKYRARIHFLMRHYALALADLRKAVELKADDLSALTWIPTQLVVDCPDEQFRRGFIQLADEAVRLNKSSNAARITRATLLDALGRRRRAQAELKASLPGGNMSYYTHYQAALLALHLDDKELYRRVCALMLQRFAGSKKPREAYFAVWACVLSTGAVEDYSQPIRIVERLVKTDSAKPSYRQALGAILFRAGRFDDALKQLQTSTVTTKDSEKSSPAYAWYFLAMTQQRLGHDALAARALQTADRLAEQELNDPDNPAAWNRLATLELLRKEATSVIGAAKTVGPVVAARPK